MQQIRTVIQHEALITSVLAGDPAAGARAGQAGRAAGLLDVLALAVRERSSRCRQEHCLCLALFKLPSWLRSKALPFSAVFSRAAPHEQERQARPKKALPADGRVRRTSADGTPPRTLNQHTSLVRLGLVVVVVVLRLVFALLVVLLLAVLYEPV